MEEEERSPVVVFKSQNLMEAQSVATTLEGSGIPVVLLNGHLASLDLLYSGINGQVQLAVPSDKVEDAAELLKELGYSGSLPLQGSTHPFAPLTEEKAPEAAQDPGKCRHCKAEVEPEANFCDQCGGSLEA